MGSSLVEKTTRAEYHEKWDAIAREEADKAEEEEAAEAAMARVELGADAGPASEAEARDLEKRAELKSAAAAVEARRASERAMELGVGPGDGPRVVVDAARLGDRRVVRVSGCRDARVELRSCLAPRVIKVFVADCCDCTVSVECALVTSFLEVSNCARTTVFARATLHTVQCDLCADLTVAWPSPAVFDAARPEGPRVFSAGCERLVVDAGGGRTSTADNREDAADPEDCGTPRDEQQFLTMFVEATGELLTERVVATGPGRLVGATARQVDDERADAARRGLPTTPDADDRAANAERNKVAGNAAFGDRDYAQAAVYYTLALDLAKADDGAANDANDGAAAKRSRAVLLANRSACFLKLGDHAKALADAESAAEADATYCKAHFRKGLALHALKRYRDALPALAKAQAIEPRNRQIAEAIKFAEMRLARGG